METAGNTVSEIDPGGRVEDPTAAVLGGLINEYSQAA